MLDPTLKEQLKSIFAGLEADFTFDIYVSSGHESRGELLDLLADVADCSPHISCRVNEGERLEFTLLKNGNETGIPSGVFLTGMSLLLCYLPFLILTVRERIFPMNRFVTV